MKFLNIANRLFNLHAKHRTLLVLRQMSTQQLVDVGIAPELLRLGVAGYPWRHIPQSTEASGETFKKSIDAREVVFDVDPKEAASNALLRVA